MAISISKFLAKHGPSKSSLIVDALVAEGVSRVAARQRVSRAGKLIYSFPIPLLPKREKFLYLKEDRNTERFWSNFLRDLRSTNTVYAAALDGIAARGGYIRCKDFEVISSAPIKPQTGQVMFNVVEKRLIDAGFMQKIYDEKYGDCYSLCAGIPHGSSSSIYARDMVERVLLDGIREWARHIGLASYNQIRIRGEKELQTIGPYAFDLAGPSYLLPLQCKGVQGFFVADVFAEGILTVDQVQYFIRKSKILQSTIKGMGLMALLVAEGFSGEALTSGHKAGILMATPKDLFGKRVGADVSSLVQVLNNAAAHAASNPSRIVELLGSLQEIEGRTGNLRGVLFELIAGYLARRDAVSIDMNVMARNLETGKTAEIDVQKITNQNASVTAIECKGKEPGGVLTLAEVEEWLRKIAIMRGHYRFHHSLREATHSFEIWTSGTIEEEAIALLESEKIKRKTAPIAWKDGQDVLKLARAGKEKGIADALQQHFLRHPIAKDSK